MRIEGICKKSVSCFMAAILALSLVGCGSKDSSDAAETTDTQMEDIEIKLTLDDYVKQGVTLPDHFDNMIYPLEALAVDYYTQSLPYYEPGIDENSFWFSMAVLSSLLVDASIVTPEQEDNHYYYSREDMGVLLSSMYAKLDVKDIPKLNDDNPYARYDEAADQYGLLYGNIGDLSIFITDCEKNEEGYDVDFQLINMESGNNIMEFASTIVPKEGAGKNAIFEYGITDCSPVDDGSNLEPVDSKDTEVGPTIDGDYDEIDGQEINDDSETAADDDHTFKHEEGLEDQIVISKREALNLAKSYMGDDLTYKYEQLITLGDYKYYVFSIEGGSQKATHVLVCTNGNDIVSGVHNDDGSWSFDQ